MRGCLVQEPIKSYYDLAQKRTVYKLRDSPHIIDMPSSHITENPSREPRPVESITLGVTRIISKPPAGQKEVTNIYVEIDSNGKPLLRVEYEGDAD